MDTTLTVLLSIFSSGIFVFIMKMLIEKSLKSYFDNNFEKKKAHIEIKKDIISKREDTKIEVLNEALELLYRNRNNYRYIFSLLCSYVDSSAYEGYEKYLEVGDKTLTLKEIRNKIETVIQKDTFAERNVREVLYKSGTYLHRCFQYVHDTVHLYHAFDWVIHDFKFSSRTQDIERNKIELAELYRLYNQIDNYYQLTREYITNYINDIEI